MNETMLTLRGNVVDAPTLRRTKNGHLVANFRVGSTQRRYDRDQGAWVDGDTLFVSVSAWRALGENVAHSLCKGQPVMVYGRYYQRDYTKGEVVRTAYELDALAIGHDLSRGTTSFTRVARPATPTLEVDETGAPLDLSREYIATVDDEDARDVLGEDLDEQADRSAHRGDSGGDGVRPDDVDAVTGEVREFAPA